MTYDLFKTFYTLCIILLFLSINDLKRQKVIGLDFTISFNFILSLEWHFVDVRYLRTHVALNEGSRCLTFDGSHVYSTTEYLRLPNQVHTSLRDNNMQPRRPTLWDLVVWLSKKLITMSENNNTMEYNLFTLMFSYSCI